VAIVRTHAHTVPLWCTCLWQPALHHAVRTVQPAPSVTHSTDTTWPILQLTSLDMHTGGCSANPHPPVLKKAKGPATSKIATKLLLSSVYKPRRDIPITCDTTLACADCWGVHTAHFVGVMYCTVLCHLILHYSFIFNPIYCSVPEQSGIQHVMLVLRFQNNSCHCSVTLLPNNNSHCSVTLLQNNIVTEQQ
jgi:hypothetical protein